MPRGHFLLEPYLYDVRSPASDYAGSLTYILYGLTDRATIGLIPTFGSAQSRASSVGRTLGINDLTFTGQIAIHRARRGERWPSLSILLQRVVAIGRYDHLNGNADRGIGGGAPGTLIGLNAQHVDRVGHNHVLRERVNLSYTVQDRARVLGQSIYGTPSDFRGSARAGNVGVVDFSTEYSINRNWVFAAEWVFRASGPAHVDGRALSDSGPSLYSERLPPASTFSIQPALEYSWSATRGILAGVRWTIPGAHASRSITPVVAFNAVF